MEGLGVNLLQQLGLYPKPQLLWYSLRHFRIALVLTFIKPVHLLFKPLCPASAGHLPHRGEKTLSEIWISNGLRKFWEKQKPQNYLQP